MCKSCTTSYTTSNAIKCRGQPISVLVASYALESDDTTIVELDDETKPKASLNIRDERDLRARMFEEDKQISIILSRRAKKGKDSLAMFETTIYMDNGMRMRLQ